MPATQPGISVIVPTYKRAADLDRCLAALDRQWLKPIEILITYREEDEETRAYLARQDRPARDARLILCDKPGVVYALTLAFDAVRTEYFAIIDDDAVAMPDWLERIVAHFEADPLAAGVGGRDYIIFDGKPMDGARKVVGKVLWYGFAVGNHHLGFGEPRYVDVLKGVNMALRTSALGRLRPDPRLRGKGAQVGWEMHLTLTLIAQGHKMIYDPQVLVEHFPGARPLEENRVYFHPVSHANEVFNRNLIVMEFLATRPFGRLRQLAFLASLCLLGTRKAPGLAMLGIGLATGYPHIWERFKVTLAANRDVLSQARRWNVTAAEKSA